MNDIIKFLNFEDNDLETDPPYVKNGKRFITIRKKLKAHYCPICSYRMYSKGIYERTVNHPIVQDGIPLVLKVQQRRWRCNNPACGHTMNDEFIFLEARKQNTKMTDMLIVDAFRDANMTASKIARLHNVSDTYALTVFSRYVDMPRRQLTEAISIDEVSVDVPGIGKYAMVIQDFISGEPADMLPGRRKELTEPYFLAIPLGERKKVRYLISDMYSPYISYVDKYFPNAVSAVDSFHVVAYINRQLLSHIREITRKIDAHDRKVHEQREQDFHRRLSFSHSREYKILKHFSWVIITNQEDLNYSKKPFWNYRLNQWTDIHDLEEAIFRIAPELRQMRKLKEKYIDFNRRYGNDQKRARPALKELITLYRKSGFKEFETIASTLEKHFESIICSFIMIQRFCKGNEYLARLSNGPMEALNRIVKDQKRYAHGFRNFDHLRNRFLFSQRRNAQILATPKDRSEVIPRGTPRGPYRKSE